MIQLPIRNAERCGGRRGGRSPTIERVDGTSIDVIGCRYTSTKTLLAPGTGAVFLTEHDIIWDRWEISQRSFAVLVGYTTWFAESTILFQLGSIFNYYPVKNVRSVVMGKRCTQLHLYVLEYTACRVSFEQFVMVTDAHLNHSSCSWSQNKLQNNKLSDTC